MVRLLWGLEEAGFQHFCHIFPDGNEFEIHDVACVVIQCQIYGIGAVRPFFVRCPYLTFAAKFAVPAVQVFVTFQPYRVGQAALADLAVAQTLVGDGV